MADVDHADLHLSTETLEAFAEGLLEEASTLARVRAHLDECAECRDRLIAVCDGIYGGDSSAAEVDKPHPSNDTESLPKSSLPADTFPGYEVVRELRRGGQGVVYQAIQKSTRRKVAIKVVVSGLFASPSDHARFQREAQILGQLRHPNIVTIFDSGTADGKPYLVMDYISGRPLDQIECWGPRCDIPAALRLFAEICKAVQAAHQRGIIHRDLKPTNIRIDAAGSPHIIDFGLACAETQPGSPSHAITATRAFVGTVAWASPEQAAATSDLDARTDVYSLGVVLFQMLTGEFPYTVKDAAHESLKRIRTVEPTRPRSLRQAIHRDVEAIILRCLDKDRRKRYANAGELAADIRRYLAGEPVLARPYNLTRILCSRGRRWFNHHPPMRRAAVAIAATLIALNLGGPLIFSWTPLNEWYERVLVTHMPSGVAAGPWRHVRLIAMQHDTDFAGLARREGLADIDPANMMTLRRMHGCLMKKLADSGAACVAYDIFFEHPSPYDQDLAAGVKALRRKNIDVVAAVKSWDLDSRGLPNLIPELLGAGVKWGVARLLLGPIWKVPLAMQPCRSEDTSLTGGMGQLSLPLAAFAAARHRGSDIRAVLLPAEHAINLYFRPPPNPQVPANALLEPPLRIRATDAVQEIPPGESWSARFVARSTVNLPPPQAIDPVVYEFGKVLLATPEQLRKWFAGRVVMVFNARGDVDQYEYPCRGKVPSSYPLAAAIEQLFNDDAVRTPTAAVSVVLTTAGALLGLAFFGACRRLHLLLYLVILATGWLIGSIVAYRFAAFYFNPLIPVIAMLLALVARAFERRNPAANAAA